MILATRLKCLLIAGLIGSGAMFGAAQQASALSFSFENIEGASTAGDSYAGNFSLEVSDLGGGEVLFQVVSAAAPAMNYFIRTIFVDDTPLTSFAKLPLSNEKSHSVGDVRMTRSAGGNLPQGNKIGFASDFNFNRVTPGNSKAIQQGETGGFIFGIASDFASLISALTAGELRFGIHLQGLPGGKSDSYVTTTTPVPLPLIRGGRVPCRFRSRQYR